MGLIKVDPVTGEPTGEEVSLIEGDISGDEALAAGQVVVPVSGVDGHIATLPERFAYSDDGNEAPEKDAVPKAGLGINMAKRQLYTRGPNGEIIPLSIGLHEVKEILKIRDSISADCTFTESVDGEGYTDVIQPELGEIVEVGDTVILSSENDLEAEVVKVLGPSTITVAASLTPGRVGWTTITRKGRPGDVIIYEGNNTYRVQTPPPEPEVFQYSPLDYEGYGEPIDGALTTNENIRLGRPQTVEESISHVFIYASSALKTIIEAGIDAGLPMHPGMTVSEVVEVINMIAGVSLQLTGRTRMFSDSYVFNNTSVTDSGLEITFRDWYEFNPKTLNPLSSVVTPTELTTSSATLEV